VVVVLFIFNRIPYLIVIVIAHIVARAELEARGGGRERGRERLEIELAELDLEEAATWSRR